MNGAEFFMKHAGCRLLPAGRLTGDAVRDANTAFSISLPLNTGKVLRLSSCWMVITPTKVTTSFKAMQATGFVTDADRKEEIRAALLTGLPCLLLQLGKRTMTARDLFVTYDPRSVRICSEGSVKTYDATKEPSWTS